MFEDVKEIICEYGLAQKESTTIRRMLDNYPEYAYRDWLVHIREKRHPNPGAYLNTCMNEFDRDGKLSSDGGASEYYGPRTNGRAKVGMNRWETCHECGKMKSCTYWDDPVEDVKNNKRVMRWYCDSCYRKLTNKADAIYHGRGEKK